MPLSIAKPLLETELNDILYNGLYEAFKATFISNNDTSEDGEDMAKRFASKGAKNMSKKLAKAIDTYVKSMEITIIPTTLIAPTYGGPVIGTANVSTGQIKIT